MTGTMQETMTFAEKLEASRLERLAAEPGQWSMEKTAVRIGVSSGGYRNWVKGAVPSFAHVQRCAEVFGWDLGPELGLLQQMGWTVQGTLDLLVSDVA